MTRIRIAGTVDVAVAEDFDKAVKEYKSKVAKENMHKAANEKVGIPTQSDLLQEVIKKGLWQIRKQNASVQ